MENLDFEKLLNINTTGEEKWDDNINHFHPYQATSYTFLELFFNEYTLSSDDNVVDFGCGKGRLNFYVNYFFNSNVTGVEMDKNYYECCMTNKDSYLKTHDKDSDKINFYCCMAEDYEVKPTDNKFYFFNPFSVQIFRKVVDNILISMESNPRTVDLILYYPSEDYIYYLENYTGFALADEIRLPILYHIDSQERFLIYQLSY